MFFVRSIHLVLFQNIRFPKIRENSQEDTYERAIVKKNVSR